MVKSKNLSGVTRKKLLNNTTISEGTDRRLNIKTTSKTFDNDIIVHTGKRIPEDVNRVKILLSVYYSYGTRKRKGESGFMKIASYFGNKTELEKLEEDALLNLRGRLNLKSGDILLVRIFDKAYIWLS